MAERKFGFLYLFNTIILFSTYEVVSKTLVGKVDSFQINFIRFLVGGTILFLFLALKRDIRIGMKDFLLVTLLGVSNVVVSMNLLQLSLYTSNAQASIAAVIFSSNPLFVFIFSAFIDKEKVELNKIAGLIMGIAGIVIISMKNGSFTITNYLSPIYALLAAVAFGFYTVIGRKATLKVGSLKMNTYSFLTGSIILLPFLLFMGRPVLEFDFSAIPQVAYLSIFVTGIAYLSYFKGLAIVGASNGSLTYFIKPVLASIIAIIFLKEHPSVNLFLGTVLIISGVFISIYWNEFRAKSKNKIEGI